MMCLVTACGFVLACFLKEFACARCFVLLFRALLPRRTFLLLSLWWEAVWLWGVMNYTLLGLWFFAAVKKFRFWRKSAEVIFSLLMSLMDLILNDFYVLIGLKSMSAFKDGSIAYEEAARFSSTAELLCTLCLILLLFDVSISTGSIWNSETNYFS